MAILKNLLKKYSAASAAPEMEPLETFVQTSVNNPDNKTPEQANQPSAAPAQVLQQSNTVESPADNTPATGPSVRQVLADPEISPAKARAAQMFASGYKPESGGFITQLYEQVNQKPQEVDEKTVEKRRKQAALVDALSLLAQTGLAAAGGNVRERRFDETASGKAAAYAGELRDIYRRDSEKYRTGLTNAMLKDYEVGYRNWADTRSMVMNLLDGVDKERAAKEGRQHEEDMTNLRQAGAEKLAGMNNDARASEGKEDRASRERIAGAQNAVNRENAGIRSRELDLRTRKYTDGLNGAGAGTGRAGSKQAGTKNKTVLFSAVRGMPGAEADPVSGEYNIALNLTPDEFASLAYTAKNALAKPGVEGLPLLTDVSKLKDEEAIRLYVQYVNPDILYDGSGDMPVKAFRELIKNTAALYPAQPDEFEEMRIKD
jgi:hypothetical protein